jgi:hypothetical protein
MYKEEYASATATTIEDTQKLVEAGFEYVTEINGVKLFRKTKMKKLLVQEKRAL